MGIADRRRSKVDEFVSPHLEQGEQIVATLSWAWTGASPWLVVLVLGYLIAYLFGLRQYALVVTDRRLISVSKTYWFGRPKQIEGSDPRGSVQLTEYKAPGVFGRLVLQTPSGRRTFYPPRIHGAEAEAVAAALGGAPPPPPPPSAT